MKTSGRNMNIMSDSEYWDLFDENKAIKVRHHRRGEKIPNGLYHLVVHSWIMDLSGLFLISQRQRGRPSELKWERTGGSVLEGECSLDGALREVREELGLDLARAQTYFIKSVKREKYHDFFDSWLFIVDRNGLECQKNPDEVLDWKWVSLEELDKFKKQGKIVNSSLYYREVYELFNKVQNREINAGGV